MNATTNTQDQGLSEVAEAVSRMDKVTLSDLKGDVIWWGAKGSSRKTRPTYAVRARLEVRGRGVVGIMDASTGRELTTCRASSAVWAAEVAQAPKAEAKPKRAPKPRKATAPQAPRVVRVITDQDEKRAQVEASVPATPEDAANAENVLNSNAPLVVVHVGDVEGQEVAEWADCVFPALDDQGEAEALEGARAQAEALRNRDALETPILVVKACANFRDLAWHANTEAARRYWQRRCAEISMVETVKTHAQANYDLGWDSVVECYTDAEILEFCRERNVTTPLDAIDAFRELTDVWAERQCGALVDGYGV